MVRKILPAELKLFCLLFVASFFEGLLFYSAWGSVIDNRLASFARFMYTTRNSSRGIEPLHDLHL